MQKFLSTKIKENPSCLDFIQNKYNPKNPLCLMVDGKSKAYNLIIGKDELMVKLKGKILKAQCISFYSDSKGYAYKMKIDGSDEVIEMRQPDFVEF